MNYDPMNLPKLDFYINDFSEILNQDFKIKYNNLFWEYQKKSWEQIATVFIKNRNWYELRDIALKLFNENGIWEKETNNWLLLVVSTTEKKIRIMTWKWMELEFSDDYCKDIIELELRDLLNRWEYEKLIQSWYEISTKQRKPQKIGSNNLWELNNNTLVNKSDFEQLKNLNQKKHENITDNIASILVLLFISFVFISLLNIAWCNHSWNSSSDSSYGWSSYSSDSSSDWWSSSSSSDWWWWSSNAGWYWD